MDTPRQILRRSASSNNLSENADELPCYGLDELADLLDSVPMPARLRQGLPCDHESTEQLAAAASDERAAPAPDSWITQDAGRETGPITTVSRIKPGDLLAGRYVIIERVDHRGMGLVYKALDRHREKAGSPVPWVALKFAGPGSGDPAEMSACLRQEFLKLSQLHHPNVVRVFDLGCHDALDFIVMEWLDGETLASVLTRITSRRIALDKAIHIVRNVARALAHAHDLGIVHGDIKPSNIFLGGSRVVKVLDFGSSPKSTADRGENGRHWATRAYASCELLQGRMPQPSDDVFSLGVTAYCLLSGVRPFGDLGALAAREQGSAPRPLPADAQDYWPAVAHALSFDAIDRPGSAGMFLQEFEEPAVDSVRRDPPSPTVAYGALAATLLASLAWWSVQSTGGLPADVRSAADNPEPLAGTERIAEQYLSRARQALAVNDLRQASSHLETARKASPGHFGIAFVEDLVAVHARELLTHARETAGIEPERAEQLLRQAERLLPADDTTVAGTRMFLAQQQVEDHVDALLKGIDERILAERLTVPEGDSALDLLRRARALAPRDQRVALTADRIMTALLFQALFAVSNGNLDDAARFIDAARAMGAEHLALARAEYELAKARRQALARRASP